MPDQPETTDDQQFGKAAAHKAEEADRIQREGREPEAAPEGSGVDPKPRAGGKASPGAPAAEGGDNHVEEESKQSFPASDPPSNY